MPLIYFIRHGQTDWNAERRIQGHLDTPLNDTGRAQAARNGRVLADLIGNPLTFDYVSSPLVRASETMEIIRRELRLDPKVYRTDLRLRELNLGDWQSRLNPDIERAFPELIARREADPWNFRPPGEASESYAMLSVRVLDWLADVDRDMVVTAHGGVMRCLYRRFVSTDIRELRMMEAHQDKILRIADDGLSWL